MDETNGIVRCGRQLCKNQIGQLRYDNIFVILQSYRFCDLVFASSITEHTQQASTHLMVNYLVELDGPYQNHYDPADLDVDSNHAHAYGNNCQLAATVGIPLNEELTLRPNPENFEEREVLDYVPIQDVAIPSTAPVQVAEISSSSDLLERLVNDILGEDEVIVDHLDAGEYEYVDFNTLRFENDFTFF